MSSFMVSRDLKQRFGNCKSRTLNKMQSKTLRAQESTLRYRVQALVVGEVQGEQQFHVEFYCSHPQASFESALQGYSKRAPSATACDSLSPWQGLCKFAL